jgi:hypothetical protein
MAQDRRHVQAHVFAYWGKRWGEVASSWPCLDFGVSGMGSIIRTWAAVARRRSCYTLFGLGSNGIMENNH